MIINKIVRIKKAGAAFCLKAPILALLIFFAIISDTYGQAQIYNWFFGEKCGITFRPDGTAPGVLDSSSIYTSEGCSSISDTNGVLLFYTNGIQVWNRFHRQMPEGFGLNGGSSSTNSAVIVPVPGHDSLRYIFTVDTLVGPKGLCYSIINLNADNGRGDVILKNQLLLDSASEKILAVRHADNQSIWLICHRWNSNAFLAYRITSDGISPAPVVSNTGSFYSGSKFGSIGYLKSSASGKKIAASVFKNAIVDLFNFNTQTGILSLSLSITDTSINNAYGLEFSPNEKVLYISSTDIPSAIVQYNLAAGDNFAILRSKAVISPYGNFGALQLGPDGRIYVAMVRQQSLSVIKNPNIPGDSCEFDFNGLDLNSGTSMYGLPVFLNSYFSIITPINANSPCEGEILYLSCDSVENATYQWSGPNGYTSFRRNPARYYVNSSFAGKYSCTISRPPEKRTYSIEVKIIEKPKAAIYVDTARVDTVILCNGEEAVLKASPSSPDYTYEWSTGSKSRVIIVDTAGQYSLAISGPGGCTDTASVIVIVHPRPAISIELVGNKIICPGDSAALIVRNDPGIDFSWNDGSKSQMKIVKKSGLYKVTATNSYGCTTSDSVRIFVDEIKSPSINHSADTTLCAGTPLPLIAFPRDSAYSYLWSTGERGDSIMVRDTGTYFVDITNRRNCTARASLIIKSLPMPDAGINAFPATSVCLQDSITLSPLHPGKNTLYYWSTGDTAQSITVRKSGFYSLFAVNSIGCLSVDSVKISVSNVLDVNISASKFFCSGSYATLEVSPSGSNYSYLWSTGETERLIKVSTPGRYFVKVESKSGCSGSDTIEIFEKQRPKLTLSHRDTVKICDGDTLTLSVLNPVEGVEYRWNNGVPATSLTVRKGGKYSVTATDEFGCFTEDSVIVLAYPRPIAKISTSSIILCPGDTVVLEQKDPDPEVEYSWADGARGPVRAITTAGKYILFAGSPGGCISTDSVEIFRGAPISFKIAESDTIRICRGSKIILSPDTTDRNFSYHWSNGSKTASIEASAEGLYSLTVESPDACPSTAAVSIKFIDAGFAAPDSISFSGLPQSGIYDTTLIITNKGLTPLAIDSIYIEKNDTLFSLKGNYRQHILLPGSSDTLAIRLSGTFSLDYHNRIIITLSSPCHDTRFVFISASNPGIVLIKIPGLTSLPGAAGFTIPIVAAAQGRGAEYSALGFESEIVADAECFSPTGKYDTAFEDSGKLKITFSGVIPSISEGETVIHSIEGLPLLCDTLLHPISINYFRWIEKGPTIKTENGSLRLLPVCAQNLRTISYGLTPSVNLSPQPAGRYIKVRFKGHFAERIRVVLYSSTGIARQSITSDVMPGMEKETELDLSGLPVGAYFIVIHSYAGVYTFPVLKFD